MGLVYDTMALSRAGFAKIGSSMSLVEQLGEETECESVQGFNFMFLGSYETI